MYHVAVIPADWQARFAEYEAGLVKEANFSESPEDEGALESIVSRNSEFLRRIVLTPAPDMTCLLLKLRAYLRSIEDGILYDSPELFNSCLNDIDTVIGSP